MPERAHLLLVPFPFTDLSASKRRPVLVLTASDPYGDFIGLPVTSRKRSENTLPLTQSEMTEGTLPVPSWIRTDRIVTPSGSLVVKTVGRVTAELADQAATQTCNRIGGHP